MSSRIETRTASEIAVRNRELMRLRELIDRAEKLHLGSLPFDDLRALGRLYRLHAARLARLRAEGDDPDAIRTLNALLVRAYAFLYGARTAHRSADSSLARVADAIARSFPYQLVAWALLAVGLLAGAGLTLSDPDAAASLVPGNLGYGSARLERLVESPAARADFLERSETDASSNFFFGSQLFIHNTRVGLVSLALGILGAIPTVLLQIYNGLVVGALSAIFLVTESRWLFLSWILPHGVPELTAICLCAAAGLQLGTAVVAPGARGVRLALREAADSAMALVAASVPFFLLAALIESFVRESALGTTPRFVVMTLMIAVVVGVTWGSRRLAQSRSIDLGWLVALSPPRRSEAPGSD